MKKTIIPLMVEPLMTDGSSSSEEDRARRSGKRWLIFSISLFILLILGMVAVFTWPYKGWLYAHVSCGGRPILGVEAKSNGSFGRDGKVAILPGDEGYDRNITSERFFYTIDVSYFCNEEAAAERGFVTQAAYDKAHPLPSYDMETPIYKLQALLDRGYTLDGEKISYGYGEWDESKKYPYYQVEYMKMLNPERADIYELTQYRILDAGSECSTNLFLPYGEAVAPEINNSPWRFCQKVGVLSRGIPLYQGIVAEYGYNIYFANIGGTLVVLTGSSFPEIADVVPLFNSLVDYVSTTATHEHIYRRDRPMDAPL